MEISFGAARFATEKTVFRPVLPMSIQPGITEMHMDEKRSPLGQFTDENGVQWAATLLTGAGQPRVELRRADLDRRDTYNLASFLQPSPRADRFIIAGPEIGDLDYFLPAREVHRLGQTALAQSMRDGHFELRWIPNDPRVPF